MMGSLSAALKAELEASARSPLRLVTITPATPSSAVEAIGRRSILKSG
jgi:hypothetical protein